MDIDNYNKTINEIINIEIETSSIAASRQTIVNLKESREVLQEMKLKINKDMKQVQIDYLIRRTSIREQFSPENFNSSKKSRFMKNRGSAASMRAKAMINLELERKKQLENYEEIQGTIDDLIEQVEDVMIEIYESMKSKFGKVNF